MKLSFIYKQEVRIEKVLNDAMILPFINKNKYLIYLLFFSLFSQCSKNSQAPEIVEPITDVIEQPGETIIEPPTSDTDRPNILFILADDLGVDATPRYPFGEYKPNMPTLERLMDEGIQFTNVWTNPVCSPTRASILTGKYGYRTGVLNAEEAGRINSSEQTIHRSLNEINDTPYQTSIIGKWHLSGRNTTNVPQEMGIGYYAGLYIGGVDNYSNWSLNINGESSNRTSYITTDLTDLAIDWISNQESPWFCWLAYNAPHDPFHLPPAHLHSQGELPDDESSINTNPLPYYLAMVESLDHEINRLLSTLDTATLSNTIIIFLGDNGTPSQVVQSPFSNGKAKGSLYQGGVHVPMVISGIGVSRQGVTDNALITSVDLYNTFLEIAGLQPEEGLDSQSFYSLLQNSNSNHREYNYTEVLSDRPNRSGYTIGDHRYKLMVFDNGNQAFYRYDIDPNQTNDLLENTLDGEASSAYNALVQEARRIRN